LTAQSRAARAALIAGGGIYFTTELIAAAAWTDPPYSYTDDFISDLGVRMTSPLAWVMNTGFFLFGLALLAGVLLLRGLPGVRRVVLVATAALLAAGGILVALVPGSGSGTSGLHGLGAAASFVAGNVLVILVGRAHRLLGISHRLGRALVGLGMLGLVSLAAFVAVLTSGTDVLIGLAERCVNYPFLIGFMVLGATAPGDSRT
jgi:hypothetical membrane protein